jgi:membrane protein involved in colicin uptake
MADTKIVVDCSTGEVSEIELTAEEVAQRTADAKAFADAKAAEDADKATKAADKAALLERLGITADEAALLLG